MGRAIGHWRSIGSIFLTEVEAGSDAAALSTEAAKTDGGYVLNGTKLWMSSSGVADVYATKCTRVWQE